MACLWSMSDKRRNSCCAAKSYNAPLVRWQIAAARQRIFSSAIAFWSSLRFDSFMLCSPYPKALDDFEMISHTPGAGCLITCTGLAVARARGPYMREGEAA